MTLASPIPADVTRLADATFELGCSAYKKCPQMIAEAIVAERARFVERVEAKAAESRGWIIPSVLHALAADLRKEGWGA